MTRLGNVGLQVLHIRLGKDSGVWWEFGLEVNFVSCWKQAGRGRSRFHNSHSYWNRFHHSAEEAFEPPPASCWNLVPALVVVLEPILPASFFCSSFCVRKTPQFKFQIPRFYTKGESIISCIEVNCLFVLFSLLLVWRLICVLQFCFFFVKLCTSSFSKTFPFWNKKLRLSFFEANKLTKVLFFKSKRGKGRLGFFILGKNNRFNTRFFNTKLFTGKRLAKFFLRLIFPQKRLFFFAGTKTEELFYTSTSDQKKAHLFKRHTIVRTGDNIMSVHLVGKCQTGIPSGLKNL